MVKASLGEFEQQVLLAALRLDGNAYSAAIVLELEARTGREVAAAAVYIALRRLEAAGLVRSRMREDSGAAGRRERRYFKVTAAGVALLRTSRMQLLSLWDGLEPLMVDL